MELNPVRACDAQVLSIYPSTIRRRILRHLYLAPMQQCYLFADCKQKFMDALLAAARMELFMPQVRVHELWPAPFPPSTHRCPLILILHGFHVQNQTFFGRTPGACLPPYGHGMHLGTRPLFSLGYIR